MADHDSAQADDLGKLLPECFPPYACSARTQAHTHTVIRTGPSSVNPPLQLWGTPRVAVPGEVRPHGSLSSRSDYGTKMSCMRLLM